MHFYDFVAKIQHEINFLPTSNHPQAKVRRFLGICFYECFIFRSNLVFPKMSGIETPSWLWSQNSEYLAKDIPSYRSQSKRAKIAIH